MDAGSAKVLLVTTVSGDALGDVQVRMRGPIGFDPPRGRLVGTFRGDTLHEGSRRAMTIFEGKTTYLRVPELGGGLPQGKRWVRFDLQKVAAQQGLDLSGMTWGSADPARMLSFIRDVASVQEVGSATIRGVDTTHYRGTIDVEDLLSGRAADLGVTGANSIPVDAWVDAEGRLRRLVYSFEASLHGQRVEQALRMDVFAFGADVDYDLPPEHRVIDMSDLQRSRRQAP